MNKPMLYFVFFVILLGCHNDNDNTPLETDPNPDPDPEFATETYKDTIFTNLFKQTDGVVAADVAHSIPIGNNNSLWVFGDSYIDHYDSSSETVPCLFQVRNAAMVVNNATLQRQSVLLGSGSPASYFQYGSDNSYWLWPNAGFKSGTYIYVLPHLIHSTGQGGFGFEIVDDMQVAKINALNLSDIEYIDLGSKADISFNHAVVAEGGYSYIYGIRDNGFGRDVFVARFPEGSIEEPWEYHGASGWTPNISEAAKIHDEFTSSFHVAMVNGKFVMITTEFSVGCNQGSEIYSYISETPYGPFTNKQVIWTVDDTLEGNSPFFYQANMHPEYDNGRNELLVTYCINSYGDCVQTCIDGRFDPDYYRPKAIRVPYSVIGL